MPDAQSAQRTPAVDREPTSPAGVTPSWLLQGQVAMCPCGCIGKRKRGSFVEKTLTGGAGLLRQAMFSEDIAGGPGLLQRVDARTKVVGMLVLLLSAALVHNLWVLVGVYAGTLVAATASGLSLGFFVKRVWFFVPVFTLVVVLPATLSVVTPGDIVVPLWSWHGAQEGLTAQGLMAAARVTTRVAVSISLVVLVTLTTTWVSLLAALRALGTPRMFVLIIGMAYRYLFLLLGSVTDMYEARKARTVGAQRHDASARRFLGASAGALFGRAHLLSTEVHQAMVARGYRGDAVTLGGGSLGAADGVCGVLVLAASLLILGCDWFLGG
ncbi:MAG: cobalt ECF transporter T component CbiQ [Dermatophilaceae bacterium]